MTNSQVSVPKDIKRPKSLPPPAPPMKKNPGINIKITSRVK